MLKNIAGLASSVDIKIISGVVAGDLNANISGIINISVVTAWGASSFTIFDFTINAFVSNARLAAPIRARILWAAVAGARVIKDLTQGWIAVVLDAIPWQTLGISRPRPEVPLAFGASAGDGKDLCSLIASFCDALLLCTVGTRVVLAGRTGAVREQDLVRVIAGIRPANPASRVGPRVLCALVAGTIAQELFSR